MDCSRKYHERPSGGILKSARVSWRERELGNRRKLIVDEWMFKEREGGSFITALCVRGR